METPIENKVEKANIKQIDLGDFTNKQPILIFDLEPGLWQGMAIKEKEFRAFVKNTDWANFENKTVGIICSADAIIPAWAFMLVTTQLKNVNANLFFGNKTQVEELIFFKQLNQINILKYTNERVMVKGCSNIPNPNRAYTELTELLVPVVKSLMFGEPCSAVPIYKNK